jgi:hypothetical protein
MPEIASLARSSLPIVLLVFWLLAGWSAAEEGFWVTRTEPLKENHWVTFVPAKETLAKQAVLIYAELPQAKEPILVRQVLSEMYSQVEDLKVLGRKPVAWRDGEGTLVSFSGLSGKNKVVGRAVIASTERGTEVFLLVRHPRSDARIMKSYEELRANASGFLTTKKKPKE